MGWLKDARKRMILCVVLAGILTVRLPEVSGRESTLAWWGTLYPQFCFSKTLETQEEEDSGREPSERQVKISFWLAKVLDW